MAAIHKHQAWDQTGQEITPEAVYLSRRDWLRWAGYGGLGAASVLAGCDAPAVAGAAQQPTETPADLKDLYPAKRNAAYTVERAVTAESLATTYNNFYEFDSGSKITPAKMVDKWQVRPWEVEVTGLVSKPLKIDVDALTRKVGLEERVYRFRCVEAWAMTVPWVGFEMRKLIELVEPLGSAKFVRFVSFLDPKNAPGQKNRYFKWPYYEALRMDEAMNPLALFVTGMYGKPLPKQNGAPLRAIVPWKYGYKSPKSIVKIEFTEKQPPTFWNDSAPAEYSFLSNVEPNVPHPRWSQATERILGENDKRVPTVLYNGYAEQVAAMYT